MIVGSVSKFDALSNMVAADALLVARVIVKKNIADAPRIVAAKLGSFLMLCCFLAPLVGLSKNVWLKHHSYTSRIWPILMSV